MKRRRKKLRTICMAGFHGHSREWANVQPESVEVWCVNEGNAFLKRIDRMFQMHPRNWRDDERLLRGGGKMPLTREAWCFGRASDYVKYMQEAQHPIYCQRVWEDIPASVRYPFEDVIAAVGVARPGSTLPHLYVTSTFGYMMAFALTEHIAYGQKVDEIRIAGCELMEGRERLWERENLLYWIGVAQGMGVKISLAPNGSTLLNAPLYGIEGPYAGTVDFEGIPYGTDRYEDMFNRTVFIRHPVTGAYTLMPKTPYAFDLTEAVEKLEQERDRLRELLVQAGDGAVPQEVKT